MSKLTTKQRIQLALKEYGMEAKDLGDGDQTKARRLHRQIEEGTELTEPTISEILERFPKISAEWLLRGIGDMFLSDSPAVPSEAKDPRPAKITLELEVGNDKIIKMRLKDKVIQLAE